MIEMIRKRHHELVEGLAQLLMSKNDIEKKIEVQRAAIYELSELAKTIENANKPIGVNESV